MTPQELLTDLENGTVLCPHCGKPNEQADWEGFTEGPRQYHYDCWRELCETATPCAGCGSNSVGYDEDKPVCAECYRRR